jgi:hypothetical protein
MDSCLTTYLSLASVEQHGGVPNNITLDHHRQSYHQQPLPASYNMQASGTSVHDVGDGWAILTDPGEIAAERYAGLEVIRESTEVQRELTEVGVSRSEDFLLDLSRTMPGECRTPFPGSTRAHSEYLLSRRRIRSTEQLEVGDQRWAGVQA